MALRKRTNAYWQKRSTERVALLERQSEPYIRKVNGTIGDSWDDDFEAGSRQTVDEQRKRLDEMFKGGERWVKINLYALEWQASHTNTNGYSGKVQ